LAGLKAHPTSLALLRIRNIYIGFCSDQLDELLANDPESPLIENLYNILKNEAAVTPSTQGRYLDYLVREERHREAIQLALPLAALYPAMVGLRETIEELVLRVPHKALQAYVARPSSTVSRPQISSVLTPQQARKALGDLEVVQALVNDSTEDPAAVRTLHAAIGDISEFSPLDTAFKDFYYYKAVYDGNQGRHWEAISLLQDLVELDPCDLVVRRSLGIEVERFMSMVIKQSRTSEVKIDIVRAFKALREIALTGYIFLKLVCLREVVAGDVASAKEKMIQLCELNPVDGDYLLAALDVAIEAKDSPWMESLIGRLEQLKADRPWDLTVTAFETNEQAQKVG
jgi:tetratricopeptide (TPR) repeat protein